MKYREELAAIACGVIALILVILASCGPKSTAAVHQFVSCAEDAVAKDIKDTVATILKDDAPNWYAQLLAFAVQFGTDSVNCAVLAVKGELTAPAGSAAITSSAQSPAIERADRWLKEHGR